MDRLKVKKNGTTRKTRPWTFVAVVLTASGLGTIEGCSDSEQQVVETGPPELTLVAPTSLNERSSGKVTAEIEDKHVTIKSWRWILKKQRGTEVSIEQSGTNSTRVNTGDMADNGTIEVGVVVRTQGGFEATERISIRIEEIDAEKLPREPGLAGQNKLIGIDSNHNAIRDDVERAIYERHQRSWKDMKILGAGAQAMQQMLATSINSVDTNTRADIAYEEFKMCIVNYSSAEPRTEIKWLKGKMLNNAKRKEAWEKYAKRKINNKQVLAEPVSERNCLREALR